MHMDKRNVYVLCLMFCLLFLGGFMTDYANAGDMPKRFQFAFGSEYVLVKENDIVSIACKKVWTDAQRPLQEGRLSGGAASVKISKGQAQRIWDAISALDLSLYLQPGDSDFEPSPPDMRHTEHLYFTVDGKTIVSWSRGYSFLKSDLRASLAAIEDEIRGIHNKLLGK